MAGKLILRPEQKDAIAKTFSYAQHTIDPKKRHFLWNAKPRFGKTVTAYALAHKIGAKRVLIITNRPAIADSWATDFFRFFHQDSDFVFASSKSYDLKIDDNIYHVPSRTEMICYGSDLEKPLIFFISLQDIKGKSLDSDDFKQKNQWVFDVQLPWDLVIIDESHEGIKTSKTAHVLSHLQAKFTLYLSGTPFRALADHDFTSEQIYNWSYLDEQRAKASWSNSEPNPYQQLPQLNFHGFQLPPTIDDTLRYDLGELLRYTSDHFVHEGAVTRFLDYLAPRLQNHTHSFWLLSHVNDCYAMRKLLSTHPRFKNYRVIVAAGKESYRSQRKLLDSIHDAVTSNTKKTITLSCGQLTTGITVPEWSTILMLYSSSDLSRLSSTQYLQASFRVQSPDYHAHPAKTDCYVFDFAPERMLTILQDFALKLCRAHLADPIGPLNELLHFANITLTDEKGNTRSISSEEIISLPKRLIAEEIVIGNFITSNKLFNLQNIFHASPQALQVLNKFRALKKHGSEKVIHSLSPPSTQVDPTNGQAIATPALLKQAFEETLKRSKFAKLYHRQPRLLNLAMLEAAASDPNSSRDRELLTAAVSEAHQTAQLHAEKQKKREEDAYRDKLRGFARVIPMLLHIYGFPDIKFSDLAYLVDPQTFYNLTGITQEDFHVLSDAKFFNETNCTLAMREFMQREHDLSHYYLSSQAQDIFNFIPDQHNHYVFTPRKVVLKMVDLLESQNPQIFQSRETTFLDPYAKSGLFLLEITKRLFRNIRPTFSSDAKCLKHIFTHQVYAWSPDPLLQKATQQTLLSFLRFQFPNYSPSEYSEYARNLTIFNPLTQKGDINMQFDIIIGNPPYQNGRHQLYADFYRRAVDLDPKLLCMIFPIGWQKTNSYNGLGPLNTPRYKRDNHLVSIDNYYENGPDKVFSHLGTGGVNIVLRDRDHDNKGQIQKFEYGKAKGTFVLPIHASEVQKPHALRELSDLISPCSGIDCLGSSRKPYGFCAEPLKHPEKYQLTLQNHRQHDDDVRLFGLLPDGNRGFKFIPRHQLPKISPNLDSYKLFVPKAWGNMSNNIGLGGSYSNITIAAPGDACSETFIEFGPFPDRDQAICAGKYFMTKFFRALLFLAKDSQNTAKDKYRYIPLLNFTDSYWQQNITDLDEYLFDLYQVPPTIRKFVLDNIQPRTEENIEIL